MKSAWPAGDSLALLLHNQHFIRRVASADKQQQAKRSEEAMRNKLQNPRHNPSSTPSPTLTPTPTHAVRSSVAHCGANEGSSATWTWSPLLIVLQPLGKFEIDIRMA